VDVSIADEVVVAVGAADERDAIVGGDEEFAVVADWVIGRAHDLALAQLRRHARP
jgi:hypothetical protein